MNDFCCLAEYWKREIAGKALGEDVGHGARRFCFDGHDSKGTFLPKRKLIITKTCGPNHKVPFNDRFKTKKN